MRTVLRRAVAINDDPTACVPVGVRTVLRRAVAINGDPTACVPVGVRTVLRRAVAINDDPTACAPAGMLPVGCALMRTCVHRIFSSIASTWLVSSR